MRIFKENLVPLPKIQTPDISIFSKYEKVCLEIGCGVGMHPVKFAMKNKDQYTEIKDIKWFLKEELQQNFNFIKNFIDKDDVEINDTSIIFLKNLASIINSINLQKIIYLRLVYLNYVKGHP